VSHHFPPDTAIGARRWEKLAHYAAARGWGLDVITHRDPARALTDAERTRLERLPAGVRVYGVVSKPVVAARAEHAAWNALRTLRQRGVTTTKSVSANVPGSSTSAQQHARPAAPSSVSRDAIRWQLGTPRGWLRMYWTWLERAQGRAWARDVVRVARQIVHMGGPHVHRAVITSGPPHGGHETGRRVAVATGLPFIMDMRDPWSHQERLPESLATPAWFAYASRDEARAVNRAVLVVANTELSRRGLAASYPSRTADIITVMNGADDDPLPAPSRTPRFTVAHAGTVYLDRDPRALFQAAARVIRELALTPDDFALAFIGELEAVGGFPIREVAAQEGIADYVITGPPRPHAEAMQFMADATMLVTMSGANMTAIPAKTFECVRFDAWLLALSTPGSATALLLEGSDADVVAPGDADGIATVLARRYAQYREAGRPAPIGRDPRFSRVAQAGLLFDAIEARIPA
jgi:hypothetical protein